ncbi:hypothetical protein JHK87_054202 [Glycine soja]|nr:hypothetical protein JHK87_054202 [Glycine soja]
MASKFCFFLFLILLPLFASSDTVPNPTTPVSPGTACKSTPDPSFCKSVLPPQNGNVYDYGRFSVKKSLSQARKFLNLVDKYLQRSSSLSATAIRALQDCRTLGELNFDFLSSSFQTVNKTTRFLPSFQADDIQTLLSAILTNQQTCLDGLKDTASAWSVRNGLTVPLSNDTKLYSVSLALFTKGWVPRTKAKAMHPTKKQLGFKNGRLPLKMSSRTRAIYESVSRRKLLQATVGDEVVVRDIVTVSQDGSGNFTTINDAIAAAPNKSVSTDGYFLIYVTAGVYEENVSVDKKKTYLMMVGDGINRTIITGNRSVVDGWTTFSSATLDPNQDTGISIHNCTIRAADDLAASNGVATYLGRPWKEYSRTVYMQTVMDSVIHAKGWREWDGDFALSTLYYAEYSNSGPGSGTDNRVTWPGYHVINATDAANFTVSNFLLGDDWLPQTGVSYTNNLI